MEIKIGDKIYNSYDCDEPKGKSNILSFTLDEKIDTNSLIIISKYRYTWIFEGCELMSVDKRLGFYEPEFCYKIKFERRFGSHNESKIKQYLRNLKLKEIGI